MADIDFGDYEPLYNHSEAFKDFTDRVARNMFKEVTCFECEHYRQDTDDGVICPRCNKGRSVVLTTNGKKKRYCLDFDEIETEK